MLRRVSACALVSVVLAVPAAAEIGIKLLTTNGRPGQNVRLTGPEGMPLYLVTASRAPQPYPCRTNAICEPKSIGPPDHWPFVRLRVLSRTKSGVITFRVPNLREGVYRAAVYCAPCYRGRAGSVIVSRNTIRIRAAR